MMEFLLDVLRPGFAALKSSRGTNITNPIGGEETSGNLPIN